jgi:4-hydroxy-tetrahydrodipicolinate synthase
MERLGQAGGPVRAPMLGLTTAERDAIDRAFDGSGLVPAIRAAAE